ncbi:uncharacterized protein LOC116181833, partial [Photinus pyralis]|uniref:uncharacterized protein LOC116181833 n=1 Tax=Photinus pyralis TaxID=7054 RepID=UPI001266F1DF
MSKKSPRNSPRNQEFKRNLYNTLPSIPVALPEHQVPRQAEPSTSKLVVPEREVQVQVPEKKCDIPKKSHFCVSSGKITLESLALGLCHLSKTVHNFQNKLKDIRMEIASKMPANDPALNVEDPGEDIEEPIFSLPLKTIDELQAFEEKLKEKEFSTTIAKVLVQKIEKTNISKSARSALKQLLDHSLYQKFSWKGQQRKDQAEPKECFSKLRTCELIY